MDQDCDLACVEGRFADDEIQHRQELFDTLHVDVKGWLGCFQKGEEVLAETGELCCCCRGSK